MKSLLKRRGAAPSQIVWLIFAALIAIIVLPVFANGESTDASAPDRSNKIVCLHTEFFPFKEDNSLPFRLVRELGRQAVLIAARDELGLATRDETLGEPFPEQLTAKRRDVFSRIRGIDLESYAIEIVPMSKAIEDELAARAKEGTPTCSKFDGYLSIAKLAEQLEPKTRGDLVVKLRELGFEGQAASTKEEGHPPQSVEERLNEMDVVSQFAAVRAAHKAIADGAPSAAWLGVLVRGYANLALLTEHHWCSDNEVFAARALLYAQRLVNQYPDNVTAQAHRVYALALVGLHADALAELENVKKMRDGDTSAAPLPDWLDVVAPFCRFEREPLKIVAKDHSSLAPLVQVLSYEQSRAFNDNHWLMESAREYLQTCPDAYGIYADLTANRPLGFSRLGAHYGPAALSHFVPLRIAALVDLPDTVQKDVKDNAANAAGANSRDEFSDVPMAISRDLVAETQTNSDTGEPSWSVLGKLIEEEQFVVAVNYLKDSRNATEQDMGDEVKRILLLLKDHRYARFLESYGVNAYTNTARFYQIVAGMPIVDARGNMEAMITQLWKAWDGDGQPQRGSLASWQAFYGDNLTYPGMLEAWQRLSYAKWQYNSTEMKTALAEKFAKISPHSPQTLRLQIENTAEPSPEQLASWEKEAGDDPSVYVSLGERYSHFEQYQDAIRCYTQSIALSPSKKAFVGLADAYRLAGNDELWQPTLERFFQTEDLGLEHAMVHQLIAEDLIKKGKWEDAEPHALAAANTWSEWGLQLAADVYEALGRGDEAEKWEREASTSYPTFAGYEWYFYCRRSGAGDVNASRELAQGYFASDWLRSDDGGRNVLLVFDMLEDNKPAALADARYLFGRYSMDGATLPNRAYFHLELAYVARDAKDADAERQAMESVHRTVEALREPEPELSQVVQFVCDLFDGKVPSADARAAMEQHLASDTIPETRRCNYEYFLGRGYELADQKAVAIEYYRRAIALGHFNTESSTLAGMRLAALHASVKP